MNYVLEAVRDKPLGLWMLDDTSPFQDYSGYSRSGVAVGSPLKHVSLTSGAVYSQVFNKTITANFDSPVFKQGYEDQPFSLESYIRPINRSEDFAAPVYRENLNINPKFGTNLTGWSANWGARPTATRVLDGPDWTYEVPPATNGDMNGATFPQIAVLTGETYLSAVEVRVISGGDAVSAMDLSQASQSYIVSGTIATFTLGALTVTSVGSSWYRLTRLVTFTSSGNARAIVNNSTGAFANNTTYRVRKAMVEKATVVSPYFDGSLPGYEWAGTANASISRTTANVSQTNLLSNPHMDGTTVTNNIRTNVAWSDAQFTSLPIGSTITPGVSYDGATWWRCAVTSAGGPFRKNVTLASLQTNRQYVASWEVANDTAGAISINVDWCDVGATAYTIQPGERRVVTATASRAYDSTYRFTDLDISTLNTSLLVREIMVEMGTGYNNYFDGTTTPATYNLAKNRKSSMNGAGYANNTITDDSSLSTLPNINYLTGGAASGGPKNVIVDLGSIKKIDQVKVWHFYTDARTYSSTKTEISVDGTTWVTIFDSAVSGTYVETSGGKVTNFTRQYARYIRDWCGINTVSSNAHWVEIKAFDTASELFFNWDGTAFASLARQKASQTNYWSHSMGGVQGGTVLMTEGGVTFHRFLVPAIQQTPQWRLIFGTGTFIGVAPGSTATLIIRARSGGGWANGVTTGGINILGGNGLVGTGAAWTALNLTNGWVEFRRTMVGTTYTDSAGGLYLPLPTTATTEDSWVDIEYALITDNNYSGSMWYGDSPGAEWSSTQYGSYSKMLLSNSEQQILGHTGQYDGLTVDDTRMSFVTKYLTTGEARAEYDLQIPRAVHAVGVHTSDKNSLYIDGELVAEADITDEQKLDQYVATDGKLYTGQTTSSRHLALNSVAIYGRPLSSESVKRHFLLGHKVVDNVPVVFGGTVVPVSQNAADVFLDQTWTTTEDWQEATLNDVVIQDDQLVPSFYAGVSVACEWLDSFGLSAANTTSIYGVNITWDGEGAVIEASLDDVTWETVERGKNLALIPPGFNPTDKELQLRISFPGGIEDDTSFVDNLNVVGLRTGAAAVVNERVITYTAPAYPKKEFTPIELRDNWGVELRGGSVTIGATVEPEPVHPLTMEVWVKKFDSATFATNFPGLAFYVNGVAGTNIAVGEWTLFHIVAAAPFASAISISGNYEIGSVALYDTALTAGEVAAVYSAYTGVPLVRANDTSVIAITEPAIAADVYVHDWSISGSG